METKVLTPLQLEEGAAILMAGGLLAIPTETVYGLGGDGLNPQAVAAIFAAKGRPQDNPLILHIPHSDWLARYCVDIPPAAYLLAERFWPGPLTMVLKRNHLVPDVVTAGLDTVGMRCPDHDATRQVIALSNRPVAAPSANTSGSPSPTTPSHVLEDMGGKIDALLDGGSCTVGVESTIIDLTLTPPRLLRPGGVTLEALEEVLGRVTVDPAVVRPMAPQETPRAPGMKYRHYAPKAPVTAVAGPPAATGAYIAAQLTAGDGVICFAECLPLFPNHPTQCLGKSDDHADHARLLFSALRAFDHLPVTRIFAQSAAQDGLGLAVANRLHKAAGFQIVHLEDN